MKSRTIIVVLAAVLVSVAGVAVAASGSHHVLRRNAISQTAVQAPTSDQVTATRALALSVAANNGEANPANVRLVATTFAAALAADTGATAPSDQEVFMVSMHGHFTAHGFDVPPGVATPTGTVISFEYDPAAGRVVGFSIGDISPPLNQLGPVQTLVP